MPAAASRAPHNTPLPRTEDTRAGETQKTHRRNNARGGEEYARRTHNRNSSAQSTTKEEKKRPRRDTRQHKAGPEIHKGKFSGACSESRCVINPYQRKRMPWPRSRVLREDSADKHSGKWNGVRTPTTQWLFTCTWSRSHASRGRLLEHEAMRFTVARPKA